MADYGKLRVRLESVVREFLAEEPSGGLDGGEGSLFETLEQAAVQVGDALACQVLQQELAAQPPAQGCCPQCGREGLRKRERKRTIQTRRGPVDLTEIECYCRPCRRSFFPSVQGAGAGAGL